VAKVHSDGLEGWIHQRNDDNFGSSKISAGVDQSETATGGNGQRHFSSGLYSSGFVLL